jgi:hypothetical protein
MDQIATEFAGVSPLLNSAFGRDRMQGEHGAQVFSAISQLSGRTGLASAPEMATATERFLEQLGNPETWDSLQGLGVNVTEGEGANRRLQSPEQVIRTLATAPQLHEAGAIEGAFSQEGSRRFMRGLQGAGSLEMFNSLVGLGADEGRSMTQANLAGMLSDEAFRAKLAQGGRAASLVNRGQDLGRLARERTGYANEWETRNAAMPGAGILAGAATGLEDIGAVQDRMGTSGGGILGGLGRSLFLGGLPQIFEAGRGAFRELMAPDAAATGVEGVARNGNMANSQAADDQRRAERVAAERASATEIVRAQTQGSRDIVGAVREVSAAIARIQPATGGSTGDTTSRGQSQ